MIVKQDFGHGLISVYKADIGEGLLAYSLKGKKENQKKVKKLVSMLSSKEGERI